MICPDCQSTTEVLETRKRDRGYVYRRYKCVNDHRFATREFIWSYDNQVKVQREMQRRASVDLTAAWFR